jgi:hypothetical protein
LKNYNSAENKSTKPILGPKKMGQEHDPDKFKFILQENNFKTAEMTSSQQVKQFYKIK